MKFSFAVLLALAALVTIPRRDIPLVEAGQVSAPTCIYYCGARV